MTYDFLTMSKNVASTAGLSGNIGGVTGQTGDLGRIVRFVREACTSVESLWADWKFLYGGIVPITLQRGIAEYTAPADFNVHRWDKDNFYINGSKLCKSAIAEFHERQLFSLSLDEGYPGQVIIMPNNALRFFSVPDSTYELQAMFYKGPKVLVANTDLPNIPQTYCPVIEAEALRRYANYDNAAELKSEAMESYEMWLSRLENDQKPGGTASDTSYGVDLTITTR